MDLSPVEIALLLVLASVVGALPPLARGWTERGLHVLVAASAGVFLGMVFLHLLPEMAGLEEGGHAHGGAAATGAAPWVAAALGFAGLWVLERWLRRRGGAHHPDPHALLWVSTWAGLSVHALAAGLGLAGVVAGQHEVGLVLVPLLWHKLTESFSLASVMRLGAARTRLGLLALLGFSLVTPLGLLLGERLFELGWVSHEVLTGLAVGTFLYVALFDLLPEVFHEPGGKLARVVAVAVGVAASAVDGDRAAAAGAFMGELLLASWDMLLEMAPWLLVGFLAAGLISQLLRPEWLSRHLAGEGLKPVVVASIAGAPLPLCSCSVLPLAASLRRAGAGRGATSAFLIATPETGVDSVSVTWGLLGPAFAAFRAAAAVLSALATGAAVAVTSRRSARAGEGAAALEAAGAACCGTDPPRAAPGPASSAAAADDCCDDAPPAREGGALRRALRHGLVDMVDDLAAPILLGVLLSGAIVAVLPPDLLAHPALRGPLGLVIALAVGIPVYVCAAASTPIAAALVLKGLSPGAALVYLLAGPATNLASLAVLDRTLGRRAAVVHLAVLCVLTLALGLAVDLFLPGLIAVSASAGAHGLGEHGGPLAIGSAALVLLLFAASYARRWRRARRRREQRAASPAPPAGAEPRTA